MLEGVLRTLARRRVRPVKGADKEPAADLQAALRRGGSAVRVYIPYGREWFPYFMRRLGERPANIGFVLKSLTREH